MMLPAALRAQYAATIRSFHFTFFAYADYAISIYADAATPTLPLHAESLA